MRAHHIAVENKQIKEKSGLSDGGTRTVGGVESGAHAVLSTRAPVNGRGNQLLEVFEESDLNG